MVEDRVFAKESGQQRFGHKQWIDQPDRLLRPHQQHAEHDEHSSEVGDDHDVFAAQAIVDDSGGGTDERLRQDL